MPWAPKRPCPYQGCGVLIEAGARACPEHERERKRAVDARRGSASTRGYGSKWRRESREFLRRNPLCADCLDENIVTAASVVDHIVPHRGDMKLFWKRSNWRALCDTHHSKKTAALDGGFGNPAKRGGG